MTCTVDATLPLATDLVTAIDDYMRESRASINYLCQAVGAGILTPEYNAVNMEAGDTTLALGVELGEVGLEIVGLTADAAVNLTTITVGTAGQVKLFIALDTNITIIQGYDTTGGVFYLNSPESVDLEMQLHDVLAVVNIGGDGDTVDGYWLELYRKLHV